MRIPILTYHKLVKQTKDRSLDSYTISEADFMAHLQFLASEKYHTVLVDDYYRSLKDPSVKLPDKCVLITFDDGHESDLTIAVPMLRKFGFKGSFFITTDWITNSGYLDHVQLRELKKSGMSVQSHAKTHRFLSEMNTHEISNEFVESEKILTDILGVDVPFVSFPGGRYNDTVLESAKRANYLACFSSKPFYYKQLDELLLIGRCTMRYISGKTPFEEILNLNFLGKSAMITAHYGKDFLKKILGNDIYYALWKKYISR